MSVTVQGAAREHTLQVEESRAATHRLIAVKNRTSGNLLRFALVILDATALLLAVELSLLVSGMRSELRFWGIPVAIVTVVGGLLLLEWQHLYRARVATVRSVELVGLMRTALVLGFGNTLALRGHTIDVAATFGAVLAAMSFAFLAFGRSHYQSWLARARGQGRFLRSLVLVGANSEGEGIAELIEDHPELGFSLVGVAGTSSVAPPWADRCAWTNDLHDLVRFTRAVDANGVVVAATALDSADGNKLVRGLLNAGVHVHYSLGITGISAKRVRSLPLVREPMFYLEPPGLSALQKGLKRCLDITLSGLLLLVTSPLLVLAAIAIAIETRGPVLFRQMRVGMHGQEFEMLKLRTMRTIDPHQLPTVQIGNNRNGGPLFKNAADPRRTRVGRFLERSSIDELPQLLNVLRGDMSLVGPRPALAEEVEQFDDELLERHSVPPGITGLWQVDARDNPSFRAYRRLDLFYIENWSVGLDLAILLGTAREVVARVISR